MSGNNKEFGPVDYWTWAICLLFLLMCKLPMIFVYGLLAPFWVMKMLGIKLGPL